MPPEKPLKPFPPTNLPSDLGLNPCILFSSANSSAMDLISTGVKGKPAWANFVVLPANSVSSSGVNILGIPLPPERWP